MEVGTVVGEVKVTRFKPQEVKERIVQEGKEVVTFISVASPIDMENASFLTKLGRLRREMAIWVKAGLPLASKEVRNARLGVCRACEYYQPNGNAGMGACGAPGCGCTMSVKAALETSKCPKGKWAA